MANSWSVIVQLQKAALPVDTSGVSFSDTSFVSLLNGKRLSEKLDSEWVNRIGELERVT